MAVRLFFTWSEDQNSSSIPQSSNLSAKFQYKGKYTHLRMVLQENAFLVQNAVFQPRFDWVLNKGAGAPPRRWAIQAEDAPEE